MTSELKKYNVTIFGDTYTIISDEPEKQVIQAADHVDYFMNQIAQKVPDMELQHVAVLAALKIASHVVELESQAEMVQSVLEHLPETIEQDAGE